MLKYAECVRSHGLSDFPDPVPAAGGGFAFRVSPGLNPRSPSPQFQSATKACQKDVPPSLANLTPAMMAANRAEYTDCMRAHGEPDFPDPNSQGLIKITNSTGIIGPSSPQFRRAEKACQSLNNGGFDEQIEQMTSSVDTHLGYIGPDPPWAAHRGAQDVPADHLPIGDLRGAGHDV